ncbi:MAG TPA: phosphoribosyltransferase [Actinobacteria bacterium]|nr:phosphoribosyltransferase [Actinomycetota bacterium]HCP61618.1 phosphoribosyltransferase [Actinomycetota bacterium]
MFPGTSFADRGEAGRRLAARLIERLPALACGLTVVLGVPRGGVTVAAEVATALRSPLDVVIPRKVGAPGNAELGLGAVAEGVEVLDQEMIAALGVSTEFVRAEVARQLEEIRRRTHAYRAGRPPVALEGRTAIVVDDGVATGGTAVAALRSVRLRGAGCVVLAVPVAPGAALQRLRAEADGVVVVDTPSPFVAVGQWYRDFDQVSDEAVVRMLNEAAAEGSRS